LEEIDVGGTIEIDGNADGIDVDIGGFFKIEGNLQLTGELEVGGKCRVGGTIHADRIEIGGAIEASQIQADSIEIGGSMTTEKGVKADTIEIGDRGRVRGPLVGDDVRIGEKADVEELYGKNITLQECSRAKSVHGVDLQIESGCRIEGPVLYTGSIESEDDVSFAVEPKKVDSLPTAPL
jgi:cytoskeletal protein CcmA (bactofilin family)